MMLLADGYEGAFLGVGRRNGFEYAIYDEEKCLEILMHRDGMSMDEAVDFFEYNTIGAWVGDDTPIFVKMQSLDEVKWMAENG